MPQLQIDAKSFFDDTVYPNQSNGVLFLYKMVGFDVWNLPSRRLNPYNIFIEAILPDVLF